MKLFNIFSSQGLEPQVLMLTILTILLNNIAPPGESNVNLFPLCQPVWSPPDQSTKLLDGYIA